MEITQEQMSQMARIYNTLLEVQTKGESTIILSDCLRALEKIINEIGEAAQKKQQSNNSPSSTMKSDNTEG